MNVIVVGGAIGGAATSLLLARAGARVTLVEREAAPRGVGAGIALAANGLAVLESLGLSDALAVAPLVSNGRVVDGRGRVLLEPMVGMPPVRLLRRSTLARILLDAVDAEPGITPHFGAEVVAAHPEGRVEMRRDGRITTLSADLVVGADGVHSSVRQGADFGARVARSGIAYLRTLVRAGLAREEEAWTSAGLFGSLPVDDGTYVYASMGTASLRAAIATQNLDALRTAWAAAYPASSSILDAVTGWDALLFNDVIEIRCTRWSAGRLVLVGDAAHAMAPNVGQGANSALVDAAALVQSLCTSVDHTTALSRYERRRKRAVHSVAATAARLGRLAEIHGPVGRALRDRILMPVLARLTTPGTIAMLMQEPLEDLRRTTRLPRDASATAR